MNVQNIELTESGVAKFNRFFADVAKNGVRMDAVILDVLNVLESRAENDESFVYELHSQHTVSGRPELLILDSEDVSVEICEDEDE
jgi:hypothetical protein